MHGGDRIAAVLHAHGVKFLFTLCGGHISPILVGCKRVGIRVIDVRHEVNAVFAADAVARLTGVPGIAAVTAGPGVTNTITAIKNAQLAQSPLVLLGGATATALKGRGALQDIDQMALMKPHVKWAKAVRTVKDLAPSLVRAFEIAKSGVPGPVFVECPVDLLYEEATVREWYGLKSQSGRSLSERAIKFYLNRHVNHLFAGLDSAQNFSRVEVKPPLPNANDVRAAASRLAKAERPVLLVGSQAVLEASEVAHIARAIEQLGVPVYLSGMGRGLLGKQHPLQMRHKRREALKEADLVILAGVPCDFRLDYGQHIRRSTYLISANRSASDLKKNRKPNLGVRGDAGFFLRFLAESFPKTERWQAWREHLRGRDEQREQEIIQQAAAPNAMLNPVQLCREIEAALPEQSMIIADGGDFVATASYIMSPRAPLSWLDPGVFGTLGVGAGFALGAKLCHPEKEVWLIYGDGSAGYSLAEFDTFARHQIPIIAVVGNDACWSQIAREQVEMLQDEVGTVLAHTDYHRVAEGFGGRGLLLNDARQIGEALSQARQFAAEGHPVLINAHLGKTDFRKGALSM
ncbi:thiamine pyrophosphate-binding protein [candidate division KSB1 bacterium]|nr:thiamine pyrophosphate-binding protein [candidate division KSB1 bacterium]